MRREFGRYIVERYTGWVTGRDTDRPALSVRVKFDSDSFSFLGLGR